jgi:hypothetical protein
MLTSVYFLYVLHNVVPRTSSSRGISRDLCPVTVDPRNYIAASPHRQPRNRYSSPSITLAHLDQDLFRDLPAVIGHRGTTDHYIVMPSNCRIVIVVDIGARRRINHPTKQSPPRSIEHNSFKCLWLRKIYPPP